MRTTRSADRFASARTRATALVQQRAEPADCIWRGRDSFAWRTCDATGDVPIRGRHNLENAMAATAAAHAGRRRARPQIAAAVRTFHAVEHRLEFVRKWKGVDFYNDSKATSVDATLKALDAFDRTASG